MTKVDQTTTEPEPKYFAGMEVGEERTLSTQEEAEQMMAELKAIASPIRRVYKQKEQKIKDIKRQVRKRQNNARRNARGR